MLPYIWIHSYGSIYIYKSYIGFCRNQCQIIDVFEVRRFFNKSLVLLEVVFLCTFCHFCSKSTFPLHFVIFARSRRFLYILSVLLENISSCLSYIYTYIHLYVCTYTLINIYINTYIHLYIYTYIHLYIYTSIHLHIYTYIHIHIYTCIHTYIYT